MTDVNNTNNNKKLTISSDNSKTASKISLVDNNNAFIPFFDKKTRTCHGLEIEPCNNKKNKIKADLNAKKSAANGIVNISDDTTIDGEIGDFSQQNEGDCWLLAGIKATANTKDGAEIIKKDITKYENGNVKVYLKGVNETYTFTQKEINNPIQANGLSLSRGDADVRAIEMAVAKHRYNLIKSGTYTKSGDPRTSIGGGTLNDPLAGGYNAREAGFLITGKMPEEIKNEDISDKVCNAFNHKCKGEADVDDYLDKISENPHKYSGVVSFGNNISKKGIRANHFYSIKSVSKDGKTVIMNNPWNTYKNLTLTRQEFLDSNNDFGFYS